MKFLKYILFAVSLSMALAQLHAQENTDSTSYEVQRKRVNSLLEARQQKFGAYDTSLTQKSGLFGLFKSKGDMQKSIDILKDVVITDNNIFLETQKLLKIKDFEKDKFQQLANDYDKQISAYMGTINKLQQQNDQLRTQSANHQESGILGNLWFYLFLLAIVVLGLFIYRTNAQKSILKGPNKEPWTP